MSESHMGLPSLAWYARDERISDFFLKYEELFGVASNVDARKKAKSFLVIGIPVSCGGQEMPSSLEAYRRKANELAQDKRDEYLRDLAAAFEDAAEYQREKEKED